MKNSLIFFLSVIWTFSLWGQQFDSLTDAYSDYFELPRESVFLHLNKSDYVKGETIWFKGYVYNRDQQKPFVETTNLYVGLFDADGKQVSKKLFRAENGYVSGQIVLDSTHTSGEYFLKASTNWMRNFKEDDAYVQRIRFINETIAPESKSSTQFDLQLLPEGGHLVNQVPGKVGVKMIDESGKGVIFKKGVLKDGKGNQITTFNANSFGLASFEFTPDITNDYRIEITLEDGILIQQKLPGIQEKGIVLKVVNTPGADNVVISIATNKETFKEIKRQPYFLLIHKDGKSKSSPFVFNKSEKEILLPVDGDFLFEGINTITLFNDLKEPIAERLIFNHHGWKSAKVDFAVAETQQDSITLDLSVLSEVKESKNLSVSILPAETRAYNHKSTIFSAFLLKPYIKGYVENPGYYFKNVDRRKEYDLDLLLLTQGWSRYDWKEIFYKAPTKLYDFEQGLTLKGVFNYPNLEKYPAFYIASSKYHSSRVKDLEEQNFEIPEVYFDTDEKVEIKLIKSNGKLKTHSLYARTLAPLRSESIMVAELQIPELYYEPLPALKYEFEEQKTVFLDEVDIVGQKKKEREINYISRNNDITVDLEESIKFPFVTDLIRRRGYTVFENFGSVTVFSRRNGTLGGGISPILYFDDTRLSGGFDLLYQLRTIEIERIVFEPIGITEGSRGLGGVIRIWSRKNSLFPDFEKEKKQTFIDTSIAFQPEKEYYAPKYIYASPLFRYFGVVHWEPELKTDASGKISFKIPNTGLTELNVYVEGMSETGELISSAKKILVNQNVTK
ncbi:hypothetical protein ACJD0Z_07410 [Flavobacteriaceae bacterium M23B6Z8]